MTDELEAPATPEVRAAALAQAREAISRAKRLQPQEPPPAPRLTPKPLTQDEALRGVLDALRDVRRALAGLEAALVDYVPSTEEGTSHDD